MRRPMLATFTVVVLVVVSPGVAPAAADATGDHVPHRQDTLLNLCAGAGEEEGVARSPAGSILITTIVGPELATTEDRPLVVRTLFVLETGIVAALYKTIDFSARPRHGVTLFIDANSERWIRVTHRLRGRCQDRECVGIETRTIRLAEDEQAHAEESLVAIREEECDLLATLAQLIGRLQACNGGIDDPTWSAVRLDLLALARRLGISGEDVGASLEIAKVTTRATQLRPCFGLENASLAPEIERQFGRWATFPELPRLR